VTNAASGEQVGAVTDILVAVNVLALADVVGQVLQQDGRFFTVLLGNGAGERFSRVCLACLMNSRQGYGVNAGVVSVEGN